jgi:thiol-disulfide isomerase/thioredoxin
MACLAAKPIVDGIEEEHQDTLSVIRINVLDTEFQALLERYRFQFTPTFILLDSSGHELWRRVGSISAKSVRRSLSEAS